MARIESKVTSRGRISIPAYIRHKLGLAPGSKVEWYERGDDVIVRRASKYASRDIHAVLFATPPSPRSTTDMGEGIRAHIRAKYGIR